MGVYNLYANIILLSEIKYSSCPSSLPTSQLTMVEIQVYLMKNNLLYQPHHHRDAVEQTSNSQEVVV